MAWLTRARSVTLYSVPNPAQIARVYETRADLLAAMRRTSGLLSGLVKKHFCDGKDRCYELREAVVLLWNLVQCFADSMYLLDVVLEESLTKLRARHPEAYARASTRPT